MYIMYIIIKMCLKVLSGCYEEKLHTNAKQSRPVDFLVLKKRNRFKKQQ